MRPPKVDYNSLLLLALEEEYGLVIATNDQSRLYQYLSTARRAEPLFHSLGIVKPQDPHEVWIVKLDEQESKR